MTICQIIPVADGKIARQMHLNVTACGGVKFCEIRVSLGKLGDLFHPLEQGFPVALPQSSQKLNHLNGEQESPFHSSGGSGIFSSRTFASSSVSQRQGSLSSIFRRRFAFSSSVISEKTRDAAKCRRCFDSSPATFCFNASRFIVRTTQERISTRATSSACSRSCSLILARSTVCQRPGFPLAIARFSSRRVSARSSGVRLRNRVKPSSRLRSSGDNASAAVFIFSSVILAFSHSLTTSATVRTFAP